MVIQLSLIALDKILNPKVLIFFLFLHENICYGFSLEVPREAYNENPRHLFSWRNKKNIYLLPTLT